MGFLHIWSQIVLHYAFIDACVLVTDISTGRGGGGVILPWPVVTEYTILFTFVRSLCYKVLLLVAMGS